MRPFKIFSKRKAEQENNKEYINVYKYDNLPETLRVQIIYIWIDSIGSYVEKKRYNFDSTKYIGNIVFPKLINYFVREYGVLRLAKGENPQEQCFNFLMDAPTEKALDIIEISFMLINAINLDYDEHQRGLSNIKIDATTAIKELNNRFKEHQLGYRFENNSIIQIDSEYIHQEVIKPVLDLLNVSGFEGAQEEFLLAHQRFKSGSYKEAIMEANKAFESTLKIICHQRNWKPAKGKPDTASNLINVLLEKEFFPTYLHNQINALKDILIGGLPTVRNRNGGHGQGVETIEVPEYMANFAINTAAANIKLLVDIHSREE